LAGIFQRSAAQRRGYSQNWRTAQTLAKRHHYVPQFYLRGFADGAQIATVRLPGKVRYTSSVRKAGAENGFHAVPGHPDGDDAFEKVLSPIEGEASRIFARIEGGEWPLTPGDRATLAFFIALQVTRGPEQRRTMDQLAADVARMVIGYGGKANVKEWARRERGIDVTDEEADLMWEQATRPGGPPIRHTALAHIGQMMEMVDAIHPSLSFRPWTLVRFEEESLLTSDSPVTLLARPGEGTWMGVGFMTAQFELYPLTRKLGLMMNDPEMMIDLSVPVERVRNSEFVLAQNGSLHVANVLNWATARQASLSVFHHPDDARFVPAELPEPRPVTMSMSGGHVEFTGEPLFDVPDTPD
jgi:hypothetical protein